MRKVKIISDGTAAGTKVLDDAGNMIGMMKRVEIVIDAQQESAHARLEFIAPELLVSGVEVDEAHIPVHTSSPLARAAYTEVHPPSEAKLTNGAVVKPIAALVHTSDSKLQQIIIIEDDSCYLQCVRQTDGVYRVSSWIVPEAAQAMYRLAQRSRIRG